MFKSARATDMELEYAADALLAALPRDPDCPAYSERQMARKRRAFTGLEQAAETAAASVQSQRDELLFLASVTPLDETSRLIFQLWLEGWTQREIAECFCISQQRVSQRLRRALCICHEAAPLSFRQFSRRALYRPPRQRILRVCK